MRSYMKFGQVVHKMLFKEKVYGHTTDDRQRPITKKTFVIVGMINGHRGITTHQNLQFKIANVKERNGPSQQFLSYAGTISHLPG